jgi:hypothetical protein
MSEAKTAEPSVGMVAALKPYLEKAPIAAFFLGISSGFPYAMIAATLTTRLAQDGISKKTVTAFSLAFLVYNLKWIWAWVVDGVRIPVLGALGQRVSWLILAGFLVIAAVANLAFSDPKADIIWTAYAAILVAAAGGRVGHVAIWLADRIGGGGCHRAGRGGSLWLDGGVHGLRCSCFARDHRWPVVG